MKSLVASALALSIFATLPAAAERIILQTRYTAAEFEASCKKAGGIHFPGRNPICNGKAGDVLCGRPDKNGKMGCVFVPNKAAAQPPRSGALKGIDSIAGFAEGGAILELAPSN